MADQITAAQLGIDYAITVVILWVIAIIIIWRFVYKHDAAKYSRSAHRSMFLGLTAIAFPTCLVLSILPTFLLNG